MMKHREKTGIVLAGIAIGVIASLLVLFGNPVNMGFCIACFLRDISGALGLHTAGAVQYIRPEILGLVLGSFLMALLRKEFSPRGGSSPLTRFVLGFFVMIGCLMFLGCPFRMILRMAGGDLNALFGLLGFVCGILVGVVFLNRGYSLKRTYKLPVLEGAAFSIIQVVLLVLLVAAPPSFTSPRQAPVPAPSTPPSSSAWPPASSWAPWHSGRAFAWWAASGIWCCSGSGSSSWASWPFWSAP